MQLAIVRDLADLPQQGDTLGVTRARQHLAVLAQAQEGAPVLGLVLKFEASGKRSLAQGRRQRIQRAGIEIAAAPKDALLRRKAMVFDSAGHGSRQGWQRRQGGKPTVVVVPAGAPRDLRQLGVLQLAHFPAVELAQLGEHHAIHVHVEAHPDRVGRHQVVHLAGLVEGHLRIARPRGQGAQHHRGAAPPHAQPFRQVVHGPSREGHHRGTRRKPPQRQSARSQQA